MAALDQERRTGWGQYIGVSQVEVEAPIYLLPRAFLDYG
jgi:hypothetical protein